MCWHMVHDVGGFRVGTAMDLDEDRLWQKVVYNCPTPCEPTAAPTYTAPSDEPTIWTSTQPTTYEAPTDEPTLWTPIAVDEPSPLEERKPTSNPAANGVCATGVNWILTIDATDSCDSACAAEPVPTVCAGDSPVFSGWPYSIAELENVVGQLDDRFAKVKRCGVSAGADFGDDDHVPEFYYLDPAQEGCSKYFLLSPGGDYKCAATTRYNGRRLCPCCKPPEDYAPPHTGPSSTPTHLLQTKAPTDMPTIQATDKPTGVPSEAPSSAPSTAPSSFPTTKPSSTPTTTLSSTPTFTPSSTPTATPSSAPTATPSSAPSTKPLYVPTATPTYNPTFTPSSTPTSAPTSSPTSIPTSTPTDTPTSTPTAVPTSTPTAVPTSTPTSIPTSTQRQHRKWREKSEQFLTMGIAAFVDGVFHRLVSDIKYDNRIGHLRCNRETQD